MSFFVSVFLGLNVKEEQRNRSCSHLSTSIATIKDAIPFDEEAACRKAKQNECDV